MMVAGSTVCGTSVAMSQLTCDIGKGGWLRAHSFMFFNQRVLAQCMNTLSGVHIAVFKDTAQLTALTSFSQ